MLKNIVTLKSVTVTHPTNWCTLSTSQKSSDLGYLSAAWVSLHLLLQRAPEKAIACSVTWCVTVVHDH